MWKDFFSFSKRERQGLLVLIALIAGVFLGKFLFTPKETPLPPVAGQELTGETPEITPAKTSVETGRSYSNTSTGRKPNDSFSKSNQTPEKKTYYQPAEKPPTPPKQNLYPASEKFTQGTVIELNTSDTLQLVKIPGIGAAFAKRITAYRSLLGGFCRLEQLQEVYGMYVELYEKIIPFLQINSNEIIPIQANTASLDKLKSHPYINFYQSKAIVEMRKKKGKLNDINELRLLEEFSEEDLNRIQPYLAF